jgi:outer membrane lipoprotein-sorting protein
VAVQRPARRIWIAVVVAAAIAHAPSAAFPAGDLFDDLYERGRKQNAGLKTLTASFTETSTSALLAAPLVERGTVVVERPSRLALRYADPSPRLVAIEGDRMTTVWPAASVRSVRDIGAAQQRIQKYFVDSSASELRSHFQIVAREASDRPGNYLITMVPKRKQMLEGVTRLELWIDRASLLLSAMRMTFPSGETKLMTFTDVKTNLPVDPSMFRLETK